MRFEVRGVLAALGLVACLGGGDARAASTQLWKDGFETGTGWWFDGTAGIDVDRGLAHTGKNNGWVRYPFGWNAVNAHAATFPGARCTLALWVRHSELMSDGYILVRSMANDRWLTSRHLSGWAPPSPDHGGYNVHALSFVADSFSVIVSVGLWGSGHDEWIQVDDVAVQCALPF